MGRFLFIFLTISAKHRFTSRINESKVIKSKRRRQAPPQWGQAMIAYFHKARGKGNFELTICVQPCNGAEFQAGERIAVSGKREAQAICKARGIKPWNF
jgi:hypothetical protein